MVENGHVDSLHVGGIVNDTLGGDITLFFNHTTHVSFGIQIVKLIGDLRLSARYPTTRRLAPILLFFAHRDFRLLTYVNSTFV